MNKILAVFHKEYLETRTFTLVFLLAGLLFPLIGTLRPNYDDIGIFSVFLDEDPVAFGGMLAVWFNATFLCATAFARERENGTFQTLRRVEFDWRVAAVGKFGCVLASTLILAAFFLVETILVAKLNERRPFVALERATEYNPSDLTLLLAASIAATSWCWGVFWTGRSSRQMTAIFQAVLCPLVVGIVAETIVATTFGKTESLSDPEIQRAVLASVVGATGLLALLAAPFKRRFGFRDVARRVEVKPDERSADGSWERVDVDKKNAPFPTLVSRVFADAALLFRSPVSALFELAILFAASALLFALGEVANKDLSGFACALFVFYYLTFASGLLTDAKKNSSILKTRLNADPRVYWLANATVAFLMGAAVWGALALIQWGERTYASHSLTEEFVDFACFLFLVFCASLWSASLKGSRIVVWTTALIVSIALEYSLQEIGVLLERSRIAGLREAFVPSILFFPALSLPTGLVFLAASYRIVVKSARYRKTPWGVAVPATLTVVLTAFASGLPFAKLPGAYHVREFDEAAFPQNQGEYARLVDDARKSVESAQLEPLFKTSDGQDAVAVELNDLRERFVDACELTKKRAASFVDAENAEAAFYAALRKALDDDSRSVPKTTEPDALALFLRDVPKIRPTSEQQADNNYLFAQYGDLEGGVKSDKAKEVLAKERVKNDRIWKRALWNATQYVPSRLDFSMKRILGDKYATYRDYPSSYARDDKLLRYNAILNAMEPTNQTPKNEISRRLLELRLAAQTPVPDDPERRWESIAAIVLRNLIAEPPLTPFNTGDSPMIARPQRRELTTPRANPEETLVPCFDEQGRAPSSPDDALPTLADVGVNDSDENESRTTFDAYYDPNAPLSRIASVPEYSPDMSNDKIVAFEFSDVYPAFRGDGSPLLDSTGSRFYFVSYNDVDPYGEPAVFVPEPVDKAPDFDCGDAKLLTSRDALRADAPQISRVRALFPFRPDGENSSVVPGLWLLRSGSENDGEQIANVKILDSTGKEPLNKDGVPKYAQKRGLFSDKRRVDKSGYDYAIDIPPEFGFDLASRNRKLGRPADAPTQELQAFRETESGEFVGFNSKDLIVEDGRVYTNFPAAAFLTTAGAWILDPVLERERYGSRVLLVEPLEPTTFAPEEKNDETTTPFPPM